MTPRRLLLTIALLLAVGALACDEAQEFDADDLRISLQASATNICPEPGGTGQSELAVVVYGPNGDVQEDERVHFDTTAGSLEHDALTTNRRGRVENTVAAPRTPGFTVTASVAGAGSESLDFQAPAPILLQGPTGTPPAAVDDDEDGTANLFVRIVVGGACHVQQIAFRLVYDGSLVTYSELVDVPNDGSFLDAGGTAQATDLGSAVDVTLTRDDEVGGYTFGGLGLAIDVAFTGNVDGTASFVLENVRMVDPMGTPYDVRIGEVFDHEIVF